MQNAPQPSSSVEQAVPIELSPGDADGESPRESLCMNLDAARRAAACNVQRATQRRRDSWHRTYSTFRAVALVVSILATHAVADVHSPLDEASAVQQQLRSVVERSSHSVFAVTAFNESPGDPALYSSHLDGKALAGIAEALARSCGSAFAVDRSGHLLTNEHVVSGSKSVWVTDDTGHVLPAVVIGTDPRTDLAVLAISRPTEPLPIAVTAPQRGDLAVALGNPDGLATDGNLAASVGCVSATGRSLASLSAREGRSYADLIQVTTPVGIGGSGGPLVDLNGHVTGLVSAVATGDRDGMPVGFAIALSPTNLKRIELLLRGEEVVHAYFGVSVDTVVPADDEPDAGGVRVERVDTSAPADGVLREGDVIVRFAGESVASDRSFVELASACPLDADVPVVVRRDGQMLDLNLRPIRRPLPSAPVTRATQQFIWAGVTFTNAEGGVRVAAIAASATMPLEVGTIVRRIDGEPVPDVEAIARVVATRLGRPLTLDVAPR